jgi:hypothetical protein
MRQSTLKLASIVVFTLLSSVAATEASSGAATEAIPECSKWDLNGQWRIVQTNATEPSFTLKMTETGLQGDATYGYRHESECILAFCGDDYYVVNGSVDGIVKGDAIELTAYWNNGTTGSYTGRISTTGRIEGSTYDKQHPQVMAAWHAEPTAKCLVGTGGTGGIGTTSSALKTAPAPTPVKAMGRVRGPDGSVGKSTLTKCEAFERARARNSPAAPGLEGLCKAEKAAAAEAVTSVSATDAATRVTRPGDSPTATMEEKFGPGGAAAKMLTAYMPENSIMVRVRYKKEYGYKADTNAFGNIGPTSCSAFSVSSALSGDAARQRRPRPISNDSRMAEVGDFYLCTYIVSDIPLDQPITVSVAMGGDDVMGEWKGGSVPQPPARQQRVVLDPTRTAVLNAVQPRARLSYEMVYAPAGTR